MLDLADWTIADARAGVDAALASICDAELDGVQPAVADAIRYGLLGEGKRVRGVLLCTVHRAAGGTGDAAVLGAAVEVVHAYSLIHDDLPCMDDDDIRRGRPTVHRRFGVPVATAAGIAMVPLAARVADSGAREMGLSSELRGRIVAQLMRASGAGGMIGGQLLDLHAEGTALDLPSLERVHRAKTGALIEASVHIGALAGGASPDVIRELDAFGAAVGLAFQIADDVLDVVSTSTELGKTAGRDAALRKSTYPALLGVDGAVSRARALVDDACDRLASADLLTPQLDHLARFVIARRS